jgi:cytochrome c5
MGSRTKAATGRVAWRRYALLTAPAVATAAFAVVLTGEGALAASFAVAGEPFKLSAKTLTGKGFVSYPSVDTGADGTKHAVTPAGFASAQITDLCQSVVTKTPLGTVIMRLTAGGTTPVEAKNLVADFDQLSGDITFTDYVSGVDASQLTGGPTTGEKGRWGQQASQIRIENLRQHTLSTTAGTFVLTDLKIDVSFDGEECYADTGPTPAAATSTDGNRDGQG